MKIIHFFFKTVLWTFGLDYDKDYKLFSKRIAIFYERENARKNLRMVYEYLKDCYTILSFHWTGSAFRKLKHHVSLDKSGLPRIIPIELRRVILKRDRRHFLACLTILALHRAIAWWPKVDLSTVVAPFDGLYRSLDEQVLIKGKRGLNALAGRHVDSGLKMSRPKFLNILTSSPNGKVSLDTAFFDAGVFLYYPTHLFRLVQWNWINKGYMVLTVFSTLILLAILLEIIALPYSLLYYYRSWKGYKITSEQKDIMSFGIFGKGHLGKLSIVKDVPGKSRVVGITNYWIQVSLKPLHDSILELIKHVSTDGTFDQEGAVNRLPIGPNEKYSSFDLSAATDRLPIEIQKDILSLFIGKEKAKVWASVLDIPFFYKGEYIKYSVGQPMGAYSSWAMLALTHHVIVNSLYEPFENREYAVLGDDMTIRPHKGEAYRSLMEGLGVKISLEKSLVNSNYIEFAKKLFDKQTGSLDAVLGPKLVIKSIQNKLLKVTLLHDSYKRSILTKRDLFEKLSSRPSKEGLLSFGHYLLFGPWGLVEKDSNSALSSGVIRAQFHNDFSDRQIFFGMYEAISQILLKRYKRNKYVSFVTLQTYFSKYCKSRIRRYVPTPLQIGVWIMFLFSPSCWLPFCTYRNDLLASSPLVGMRGDNLEEVLTKLDLTPLSSDGNPSRKSIQDMRAFLRSVSKEFDKAQEFWFDAPW